MGVGCGKRSKVTGSLRIDHQALKTLLSTKGMTRAGMRIARLMCFQYDVQYHAGSQNIMADYLSRVPLTNFASDVNAEQDLSMKTAEVSPQP